MAATAIDLEALYARHREPLLLFLARRTADPQVALDLWAETFAHAAAGLSPLSRRRPRTRPPAGCTAIARRRLARYYRRGHAERRALDRLQLERPPADPGLLARSSAAPAWPRCALELAAALAQLSPAVRDAVQLRVVDELSYPDVARRLGDQRAGRARPRVARPGDARRPARRTHDPRGDDDMNDSERLERYLDDFGARLPTARRRAAAAPRRRRYALATAVALAAIGVATLGLCASGERLDPIAEARAALAPPGDIVYMKITSQYDLAGRRAASRRRRRPSSGRPRTRCAGATS